MIPRELLAHRDVDGGRVVVLLCGSGFRETFVKLSRRPMQPRRLRLDDHAATLEALRAA